MNSPKQILFLIVFISSFGFQSVYSQIPDSLKLKLHSEHTILNSNVKCENFFDITDYYFFSDTLFKPIFKYYISDAGDILIITDINITNLTYNCFKYGVNPDLMNLRISNISSLEKFLFKHCYKAFETEYRIKPPIFGKELIIDDKK